MKVERKADHAVGDASCKAATGKTLDQWFKQLDKEGGAAIGRRQIGHSLLRAHKIDPWWASTITNEYEIARGALARDGKPRGYTICATKSIKADAKTCYRAFATAAALDEWFGPGHDVKMSDGGHWRNADSNSASIRKVAAGKSIRMIAEDAGLTLPSPVEIKFSSVDQGAAKCTVMVTIDRLQTRAEADGYRRAWGEALERLKATLE